MLKLKFEKKWELGKYEKIFNNLYKRIKNLEEKRNDKFTINEFF